MTLRGILLAGKWRDDATLKTYSDGDYHDALIVELGNHSNNEKTVPGYWQQFRDDDVLIGKGAVVVFLLQAGILDLAGLKDNSDPNPQN
jgi:hypothetical protein